MSKKRFAFAILVACFLSLQTVSGQQVYSPTPTVGASDSFFEWYGIDWGFAAGGRDSSFFFSRGGSLGTIPTVGGFNPNAGASFGFSNAGSNGRFSFNMSAAQGSRRTITSSTPSVTLPNGGAGAVISTTVRPFVTGLIPVVGAGYTTPPLRTGRVAAPPIMLTSPVTERLRRLQNETAEPSRSSKDDNALVLGSGSAKVDHPAASLPHPSAASSAERGDISVAEIRRRQAARPGNLDAEIAAFLLEAEAAESAGRFGAARIRYKQAAARATGSQRQSILDKLDKLADK